MKKEVEENRTINLKNIPKDAAEGEPITFKLDAIGVDTVLAFGTTPEEAKKQIAA